MGTTERLSITLPQDMAREVEQRVSSGRYGSASEVIQDGIQALRERDAALERWLREDVMESRREYKADPSTATAIDDVLDLIRASADERRTSMKPA